MIDPSPRPSQPVMKASPKQTSASHHLSAFRVAVWALLWFCTAQRGGSNPCRTNGDSTGQSDRLWDRFCGADLRCWSLIQMARCVRSRCFPGLPQPPDLLHYVVSHPERYRDFARNMTV